MNRFRERIGSGPIVVIAHRGDSAHAPENTLEAALLGHAAGAFAWELDVLRSRDGVAVVMHDETLRRTTDVAVRYADDPRGRDGFHVADFDWAEIRTLDAGSWFVDPGSPPRSTGAFGTIAAIPGPSLDRYASGSIRVPSLVEALSLTRDLDWLVNIELKSFPENDPGLLDAVFDAIDATGTADRVLISSFNHEDVAKAARERPEIATGILSETPILRPAHYVRELARADFLHVSAASLGAESRAYRLDPRGENLSPIIDGPWAPRLVYTVNDASPGGLAVQLAALGVAGVFTDDPSSLRRLWPDKT